MAKTEKSNKKLVCKKCGASEDRLLLLGLAIAFGARTRDPSICVDGEEHEFVEVEK